MRTLACASVLLIALGGCSPPAGNSDDRGSGASNGTGAANGAGGEYFAPPGSGGGSSWLLPPDTGGASGTGGGVSGINDKDKCGGLALDSTVEIISEPGNVVIVFDQSLSMDTIFDGVPLWQGASTAVRDALAPHADNLTIGAIFYPTVASALFGPCNPDAAAPMNMPPQIPFQHGPQFLLSWDARWAQPGLVLGTPTDAGMNMAAAALATANLVGQVAIILVTDGQPTCTFGTASDQLALQWAGLGIPTYVIGLPGAAGLETIARNGGTGTPFTPSDSASLQTKISEIMGTIIKQSLNSCTIEFNEVPDNITDVALVVTDAATQQRFKIEPGPQGYEINAAGDGAELLGATCSDATSGTFSNVSFEFGCEEIPILR